MVLKGCGSAFLNDTPAVLIATEGGEPLIPP